jgi:hypothetical protein
MKSSAVALAVLVGLTLAGCGLRNDDEFDAKDGNAGFMASEVSAMSEFALNNIQAPGTAKAAAPAADTITVEISIVQWHYDANAQAWVRSVSATFPNGTRTRLDTIYFKDSTNTALTSSPALVNTRSLRHVRSVVLQNTNNSNNVTINFEMNVVLTRSANGDTLIATKNGSSVGTFNDETFRTVTITNVVRKRYADSGAGYKYWHFPASGTIFVDRPLRTVEVEYTGSGTATATVTRKKDEKTTIVQINVLTGTES